jgi:hypothetical protein
LLPEFVGQFRAVIGGQQSRAASLPLFNLHLTGRVRAGTGMGEQEGLECRAG